MWLLRRRLNERIGRTGLAPTYLLKLWAAAASGAAVAWGVKLAVPTLHPIVTAILVLGSYGLAFFGSAMAFGISEAFSAFAGLPLRRSR
jgi:putative peptidoglycan lipid II flippase